MISIRYVLGSMLAFVAAILLTRGQYFSAFFWGFAAIVLLPSTLKWIERKERHRLKPGQKLVIIAISCWLGAVSFDPPPEKPQEYKYNPSVAVPDEVKIMPPVKSEQPEPSPATISTKQGKKVKSAAASNAFTPVQHNIETTPTLVSKPRKKAASVKAPTSPSATAPKKIKKQTRSRGCSYNGNPLYVGPRGGCYYFTGSGRKEYVDRSYCSGCN